MNIEAILQLVFILQEEPITKDFIIGMQFQIINASGRIFIH